MQRGLRRGSLALIPQEGGALMTTIAKAFTALAAVAFVLAVLASFTGPIVSTGAEAFSRACSNLALLAIALIVVFERPVTVGRSTTLP
jgi:hypothetical protein